MRGLVLEGGGARGAYQIGVVKALYENGYSFDGFVGTSIGSINAAMLAQGDLHLAFELWNHLTMEQIFLEDDLPFLRLADFEHAISTLKDNTSEVLGSFKKIIGYGINTGKMKHFLERYINEEKIRNSSKEYGLITVSMSHFKPYKLMLEDIEEGKLISYVMASSSVPGFHHETIDNDKFIDGFFYDNCPYRLLLDRGYDDIITIRLFKAPLPGTLHRVKEKDKVKIITPGKNLGNIALFTPEHCEEIINIGYEDGLRFAGENK